MRVLGPVVVGIALMIVSTSMLSIDASADVPPKSVNIKTGNYWTYTDNQTQSDSTGDAWLNTTTTTDVVGTDQTLVEGNLTEVYNVVTTQSGTMESASDYSIMTGTFESTRFDARLFSNYSLISSEQFTTMIVQNTSIKAGCSMSLSPAFDDHVGDELISLGWNTTVGTTASVSAWYDMPIFGNTTYDGVLPMNMIMDVVAENVPITTPAGTFLCCEINVTIAPDFLYSGSPMIPLVGGIPFATMTLYYSYDVGNYVTSYYHASISGVDIYRNQTLDSYFYSTDFTPPVADAGPDRTVVAGTKCALDGTMSTDSESTLAQLNFTWNFTYDGAVHVLYGAAADFRFFVPGVYNVTLNVTDPGRNYDVTWVAITVIPDTSTPVAIAGPDQLMTEGNWAVLDGSSSHDTQNLFDELNFTWTFEYDSIDRTLEGPAVMFQFEEVGNYEVTLAVSDPVGHSGVDSLWVNVTPIDFVPPVADAGPDQSVPVDTNVMFNGSGSYDNVIIVNWTWRFNYDGMNLTLYGPQPEFEFNQSGTYQVTLIIRDASNNMGADTLTIHVVEPPVADAGEDGEVHVGDLVYLNASGSSDDTGIENYTWTFEYGGETTHLYGVMAEFTFDIDGTYDINLTVTDEHGLKGYDNVTVTVTERSTSTGFVLYAVVAAVATLVALLTVGVLLTKRKGPK